MSNRQERRAIESKLKSILKKGGSKAIDSLVEDHAKAHCGLQVYKHSIPPLLAAISSLHKLAENRQEDSELNDALNKLEDAFVVMTSGVAVALGIDPSTGAPFGDAEPEALVPIPS